MSKRFFPQQYGDRKKAKLDVTISDHNFPLSQNKGNKCRITIPTHHFTFYKVSQVIPEF